jgi:hypothetical protein
MAESINLTVDRREDFYLQVYWTDLNDVAFYVTAAFMNASSGGTVLLSSDNAYVADSARYAACDLTVTPAISSTNLTVTSEDGLVTISVPYNVVSGWTAGSYTYSIVVKYTGSVTTENSYRKVLMTGTLVVV